MTASSISSVTATPTAAVITREIIENLKVGDLLTMTFDADGRAKALSGARWGESRRITKISYRGVSRKGLAYVGGYTTFGENSEISFSIDEEDQMYRVVLGD